MAGSTESHPLIREMATMESAVRKMMAPFLREDDRVKLPYQGWRIKFGPIQKLSWQPWSRTGSRFSNSL